MEENINICKESKRFDIEKIAVYAGILVSFLTIMIYIADIKERTAKLEVKVEHLEQKK